MKAFLEFAVRNNFRLTYDLFVPDPATWLAFAQDTLQRTSINSISAYATLLNKASAQLADHLGSGHPLHARLTANLRKPWLGDEFDKHSSYKRSAI